MEGWGRPDGYCLEMPAPSAVDYVRLRDEAGLTPCTTEQARLAISGSWAARHVSRRSKPLGPCRCAQEATHGSMRTRP